MQSHDDKDLITIRKKKIKVAKNLDSTSYFSDFTTSHDIKTLCEDFQNDILVAIAGRICAIRDMGKSRFFDLSIANDRIQCFLNIKNVPENKFKLFNTATDIGDWAFIKGETFTTKMGENSIRVLDYNIISKAIKPLPDKWHGLEDTEIRYRQRYLDLIANKKSLNTFILRSNIIAEIRSFLHNKGYLEVETPMMQDSPGGAAATPFKTHHNALSMDLFLRIAPELFLKRLLVGGFQKVFELNRNFRNEGISRRHNPEFTMLEAYEMFSTYEKMAEMVEELICHLAKKFHKKLVVEQYDPNGEVTHSINFTPPWKKAKYRDLIENAVNGWFSLSLKDKKNKCKELNVEISADMQEIDITQQVFEKLVEEKTIDPVFVTHLPAELIPLAKSEVIDGIDTALAYELIINGNEISPGYSELNDPKIQKEKLLKQSLNEKQALDMDFINALEYGMPPAGGIGIGIDRLTMILSGAPSIRDVILFPQLKSKNSE